LGYFILLRILAALVFGYNNHRFGYIDFPGMTHLCGNKNKTAAAAEQAFLFRSKTGRPGSRESII
jgi:hypothetical protein